MQSDSQINKEDRFKTMLMEKSSSRIGRLNKRTQQIAIQQLINENQFTKEYQKKVAQQERQFCLSDQLDGIDSQTKSATVLKQLSKRQTSSQDLQPKNLQNAIDTSQLLKSAFDEKDKKRVQSLLKQRCEDIIEGKAKSGIINIVQKMKQKKGIFPIAFYKDNILQYHNETLRNQGGGTHTSNFLNKTVDQMRRNREYSDGNRSGSDDKKNRSAFDAKNASLFSKNLNDSQRKNRKRKDSDDLDDVNNFDYFARKYSYYHLKHAIMLRNPVVKQQTQQNCKSAFKSLSRDQLQDIQDKKLKAIPGVGKYYPNYEGLFKNERVYINQETEEDYIRSKNFLIIPRFHSEYKTEETKAMKSQRLIPTLKQDGMQVGSEILQQEMGLVKGSKSSINLIKTLNSRNHQNCSKTELAENYQPIQIPNKLIPYNKQSSRKFVFEKCCPVNEQRFNLMNLPQIYFKNKRVRGAINFTLASDRTELFPQKQEQPNYYSPNIDILRPRKGQSLVNLGIKPFKNSRHQIEPEDPNYYNQHMI